MRTFYLLLVLCLAALNLRPTITSVAPLLETIQSTLGMSGFTISLLTTLPVLCMGIFAPFATKMRDRVGLERSIFIALVLVTAATAMRGIAGSAIMLITTAFIAGIGIGLAGPLLSGFIKKYFPSKPGIVSVYSVSMTVGAGLASALAIPIYTRSSQSLTLTLGIWSLLGLLALVGWIGLVRHKSIMMKQNHSRLPIRNRRALLLTLFFGLMASIFYSLTAWISPIAQSMGHSKSSAAIILTVFTLVQIPVSMVIPAMVSRFGKRKWFLVLCSMFELAGIIMLMLHLPVMLAVISLGIGAGGLFPLALMLPIVETRNAEEAGSWSALSQSGGYVIGAMGPLVIGIVHDFSGSFTPAFVLMLAVIVVMIAVQLLIGDRAATDQREAHAR
ncbi:MFS transporter [Paenibacillus paridis]|uniref:MFS transporter n=1 Tax=Paenibacillus paridis TaxID=2583376 RepID=UPI00111EB12F|nr:MFS transporter [Paenibacillus paridis]